MTGGPSRIMSGPRGEEYHVATSRDSDKSYTCPACSQTIAPRVTHIVAWAVDSLMGREAAQRDRRHWHTTCWETFGRTRG